MSWSLQFQLIHAHTIVGSSSTQRRQPGAESSEERRMTKIVDDDIIRDYQKTRLSNLARWQ